MQRAALLAVLVLLAGCTAGLSPDGAANTPTATDSWGGNPDNHFREQTLTVAVVDEAGTGRDYAPLVREGLDYWEANAEQYVGFGPDYVLVANDSDTDLRVRFVATIEECGSETSDYTAGCAPFLDAPEQVNRPVGIRVETGYSNASTVAVVKHEFGHTLGLRHSDEPTDVMAARSDLTTLSRPNATERALPWESPELTYDVDDTAVPDDERAETRRQVRAAFGYFTDGADGTVPENVTFTRTTNRSAADVVVRFAESDPCTAGAGSCGGLRGTDPDGDGALETYTRLNVTVVDIPPEARGWHVGYWTALGFGLRGEELPAPLRSEDPSVRRSDWWA